MQRRVTSYDLARLSYNTIQGLESQPSFLTSQRLPSHRAMSPDGCDVVQRRTITHDSPDGPRSPKFTNTRTCISS